MAPVVPVLSALACLYPILNLSVETWLRFTVRLVTGLAVYLSYGRRHARLASRAAPEPGGAAMPAGMAH